VDVIASEVRLHLDELVLTGFPRGDRVRIADAVQAELGRLLGERVPPGLAKGGPREALDAGAFTVPRGARPADVGERVARALYRALGG
jgi:hypothetical protein